MKFIIGCMSTLICLFLCTSAGFTGEYQITPPPDWVTPLPPEDPGEIPEAAVSNGSYFLLVDTQAHPTFEAGEFYKHFAEKVVNQGGIEALSQVLITFDPSYQSLAVHRIAIHRNGKILDRLDPEKISLLQREEALETQIYDGSKTFTLILDDLRVGDILEYSFTLRGANPVFGGRYYHDLGTQWRVPVHRFRHRLLWPEDRTIYIKHHGKEIGLRTREIDGMKEYLFSEDHLPAIIPDSDLPPWYSAFPWLQFSEAATWGDVARWGAELYALPEENSAALDAKIQEILEADPTPEGRVIQALRFVQDDIRYMGIEIGPASHQPHEPSRVLQRRFGDCKDKAFLLHKMLHAMDIESRPALVHTRYRHRIRDWRPSPNAFNHVILQTRVNGRTYWMDPTWSYQRGSLQHFTQPDYSVALVLDPETRELSAIEVPDDPLPDQEIEERFDVSGEPDDPVAYTIRSVYRRSRADLLRGQFDRQSTQEIEKSYLNYYAAIYPDILLKEPISVEDDIDTNTITVTETYTIPHIWQPSETDGRVEATFQPLELYNLIALPATRRRSMPLHVDHPVRFQQTTHVDLSDDWEIGPESVHIEDEAMVFDRSIRYEDRHLTISNAFRTRTDHVSAEQAPAHLSNLKRLKNELGYLLYTPVEGPVKPWKEELNWTVAILAGFVLCFGLVAAHKVYRYDAVRYSPAAMNETGPKGIHGWLWLAAFAISIKPLVHLYQMSALYPLFTLSRWNRLTAPGSEFFHPLWQPLLIYELVFNILWLVFAVLMVILFFQKRNAFPRIFIIYLVGVFLLQVVDQVWGQAIPSLQDSQTPADFKNLIRAAIHTTVWSLYFHKSQRVKNTFVHPPPEKEAVFEARFQEA
ncbi:MAG: DUF3857 domain-containing protein [Desulfococcaceae bacterium]